MPTTFSSNVVDAETQLEHAYNDTACSSRVATMLRSNWQILPI